MSKMTAKNHKLMNKCTEAKYVESSKFIAGVSISTFGGSLGAYAAAAACVGLGIPTGGGSLLVCAVVGGAAGGWLGGKAGSAGGALIGEKIYEVTTP
jgi:hypothetical protein